MTDDLEARRERNIRERANRPYFKRVFDEMTSGYQPDQTSSNSIYLRPRVSVTPPGYQNLDDYTFNSFGHIIQNKVRINSIITRLRIWVRKALKLRRRDGRWDRLGPRGRNQVGRSGFDVVDLGHGGRLRLPMQYGVAIPEREYFNAYGNWTTAVRDYGTRRPVWKKNERARLF